MLIGLGLAVAAGLAVIGLAIPDTRESLPRNGSTGALQSPGQVWTWKRLAGYAGAEPECA